MPLINWQNLTKKEITTIHAIALRASETMTVSMITMEMDIAAAHLASLINLEKLLKAENFDFLHDVCGITVNIDRKTGKLDNCFVPRFAKEQ